MSDEQKRLLSQAEERLKSVEEITREKLNEVEEEKRNYVLSNMELIMDDDVEIDDEEVIESEDYKILEQSIKKNTHSKMMLKEVYNKTLEQVESLEMLVNFNAIMGNTDLFFKTLGKSSLFIELSEYNSMVDLASKVNLVSPVSFDELKKINIKSNHVMRLYKDKTGQKNLVNYINTIKDDLHPILNAYYKIANFIIRIMEGIDERIETAKTLKAGLKDRFKKEKIEQRKNEIVSHLNEYNQSIDEIKKKIAEIESAKELLNSYKDTYDEEELMKLISVLSDLLILSSRDVKIITYRPSEKNVKEEVEETSKPVIKSSIPLVSEKVLDDPLYYKKADTQNIICFLGKDDDDIFTDISDHFDFSNRPFIVSELVSLFNVLYKNADYENKTGGNPKYFSSSKVRAYREKLGFNYKRFGVSQAQYRIHAVTRDSKLLKELGYGTGRVTFFGALGVNDDNEKTGAYDRIARRGISAMGTPVKLQPNFDYIEHITRRYIPIELLSEADKGRLHYGMFNGNLKGTSTKKAIEGFGYMYYDILDTESKENVKKWLDNYFMRQSEKMFEIINEHNNRKKRKND